ncbi:DUF4870 domain-containing protein [Brachybacterium sp. AOP43-C2-M15]|uniref:DUF4870 domain-containing protein n=1 Tax=Brachybacterium sp. AOP43-C2-M15 TaxID=3457661 RepID=UPI0040342065
MSQTPHPHDPYGTEPGPSAEQGAPTSDPALHPHDPYAYDASSASAPSAPSPNPAAAPFAAQQPPQPQPSQSQPSQQHTSAQAAPPHPGSAPEPYVAAGGERPDEPGPGAKGVYEGALSGQPISRSDSRLWAMFSQLAVVLGHVVSWGFLGWIGPLVIFLMYKDRDRFVRFHAAEALNGAIAVVIAQVVLTIAIAIFGVVTIGFGWALFPLAGLPALLQLIFSIIGAVKANQGEYWNYPFNIRLVK